MSERGESDQLPEEGPAGQVHDDDGGGVRDDAKESAGTPGEEGQDTGGGDQATGNPKNAGE